VANLPLLTAGSGLALGLPANFLIDTDTDTVTNIFPKRQGFTAVVSGSCSVITIAQVKHFVDAGYDSLAIDPCEMAAGKDIVSQALDWALPRLGQRPILIYSSAETASVKLAQAQLGVVQAGELIEKTFAAIAVRLVAAGVAQLVIAGGETSGACVKALGISHLTVGPQVAPGVPWCHALVGDDKLPVHVLLKSGNFGQATLFSHAFELLP